MTAHHKLLKLFRRTFVGLGVLTLAVSAGCGGESRVPVFPVSGKLIVKGQPAVGAQVVLQTVKDAGAAGVAPSGTVKDDGSFVITSYDSGDGAPAGEYVALIQWFKFDKELNGPGPNVIPAKYAAAATTPVKGIQVSGPT